MSYENISLEVNETLHRFEITSEGHSAFIIYRKSGTIFYLLHTEAADELEGKGAAAALVEKTFNWLEEHHFTMVPRCSYIQHYLQQHPEWNRLVQQSEN